MWTRYDPDVIREELGWARAAGLDTLRCFLFWPDLEPEPRRLPHAPWDAVMQFLDAVEEAGLTTWPTLLVGHMSGENWDPPWRAGRDLWTDPGMLDETEWFLGEAVRRLGAHPAVAGWVLTNEWPLWAGPTTVNTAWSWLRRMTAAVRAADPRTRPLSMGDGMWSALGHPNGISWEALHRYADIVGPHVYPEEEDPLAVAMTPYEATAFARGSRPVLLEEFGTTDAFGSRESQAAYYASALAGALVGGAVGAWAWCLSDFALDDEAPYSHHPFELGFGLFTVDGEPKSTARVMTRFRELADHFGPVEPDPVGVLLPALATGDVPFPRGPEPAMMTRVGRRMLRELCQLGVNPVVVREPWAHTADTRAPAALDGFRVLLLAAPRIGEPFRRELWQWVERGGTLYCAYSHTGWWPDPESLLGIRWTDAYGVRSHLNGRVEVTGPGFSVRWDAREVAYRRAAPTQAEVLARVEEQPVLFRRTLGRGQIFTSVVAWEEESSVVRRWFSRLLGLGGVEPLVPLPAVGLQCGRSRDGDVLIVNHGENPVTFWPRTRDGLPLEERSGLALTGPVTIAPHTWWWGRVPGGGRRTKA
jgi:hypothetical protein